MTPIREVRRLAKFWRRACQVIIFLVFAPVILWAYLGWVDWPPVFGATLLAMVCVNREHHWRCERLAIIHNRRSFRRR